MGEAVVAGVAAPKVETPADVEGAIGAEPKRFAAPVVAGVDPPKEKPTFGPPKALVGDAGLPKPKEGGELGLPPPKLLSGVEGLADPKLKGVELAGVLAVAAGAPKEKADGVLLEVLAAPPKGLAPPNVPVPDEAPPKGANGLPLVLVADGAPKGTDAGVVAPGRAPKGFALGAEVDAAADVAGAAFGAGTEPKEKPAKGLTLGFSAGAAASSAF